MAKSIRDIPKKGGAVDRQRGTREGMLVRLKPTDSPRRRLDFQAESGTDDPPEAIRAMLDARRQGRKEPGEKPAKKAARSSRAMSSQQKRLMG